MTEERQFALVRDGVFVETPGTGWPLLSEYRAEAPGFLPAYAREGDKWLPIVNRDSEPFDGAKHYRLAPVLSVSNSVVFRTYPVIDNLTYHARELGIPASIFGRMITPRDATDRDAIGIELEPAA